MPSDHLSDTAPFSGTLLRVGWEDSGQLGDDRVFVARIRLNRPISWPMSAVWEAWPVVVSRVPVSPAGEAASAGEPGTPGSTEGEHAVGGAEAPDLKAALDYLSPHPFTADTASISLTAGKIRQAIDSICAALAESERKRVETIREVASLVGCVQALQRHTNPHNVDDGHSQQWFAVHDAIQTRIKPLLSSTQETPHAQD